MQETCNQGGMIGTQQPPGRMMDAEKIEGVEFETHIKPDWVGVGMSRAQTGRRKGGFYQKQGRRESYRTLCGSIASKTKAGKHLANPLTYWIPTQQCYFLIPHPAYSREGGR